MRRTLLPICLLLILASCGSDELTLTEYAERVEIQTSKMYSQLEVFTADEAFAGATVDEIQSIYGQVAEAYRGLADGLQAIEAPTEIVQVHEAAVEVATRLAAAGEAMAGRAAAVESPDGLDALFASREAHDFEEVTTEMIAFCQERQAEFDATADRDVFADTPWIPAEMQEIVLVAFGCDTRAAGDS